MLESWVRCVGRGGGERKVVVPSDTSEYSQVLRELNSVQMTCPDIDRGLGEDLRSLHGLAVPKGCAILTPIPQIVSHTSVMRIPSAATHEGDFDTLSIGSIRRVLVARANSEIL